MVRVKTMVRDHNGNLVFFDCSLRGYFSLLKFEENTWARYSLFLSFFRTSLPSFFYYCMSKDKNKDCWGSLQIGDGNNDKV